MHKSPDSIRSSVNDVESTVGSLLSEESVQQYTLKPTIVMCNPNALFYQQMVTAPNAYWLNFFLKRDCNVVCWNYRGYGESSLCCCDFLDPSEAKRDAEHVLARSIEKLRLKGKIGAYGRSIGGIAACHLAGQYPDLIEALIVDRSLSELRSVVVNKLRGCGTTSLFNCFTNNWTVRNVENYVKATNCFKIITCDSADDTVELYSSVMVNCASALSRQNYNTKDYRLLFDSIIWLLQKEEAIYRDFDLNEKRKLNLEMF